MRTLYYITTRSGKAFSRPGYKTGVYRSRGRAERDMAALDADGFGPCRLHFAPRGLRIPHGLSPFQTLPQG